MKNFILSVMMVGLLGGPRFSFAQEAEGEVDTTYERPDSNDARPSDSDPEDFKIEDTNDRGGYDKISDEKSTDSNANNDQSGREPSSELSDEYRVKRDSPEEQ